MKLFSFKRSPSKRNLKEKDIEKIETQQEKSFSFTKKIVVFVLINGIIWVWCSYVLAFLGRVDIAESLSSQVVTVILGTGLGYFLKSVIENVSKYGFHIHPSTVVDEINQETQEGMEFNTEDNEEIY